MTVNWNYSRKKEEAVAEAEAKGFLCVWGDSQTLLVDLDNGAQLNTKVLDVLKQCTKIECIERWKSKSGKGEHVVIRTENEWTVEERLLWQACLGSDPMREALGLILHRNGVKDVSVLFAPPGTSVVHVEKLDAEEAPF